MKSLKKISKFSTLTHLLSIILLSTCFLISWGEAQAKSEKNPYDYQQQSAEDQLLDNTFRIDIKTISVTYDYYPQEFYALGRAVITFVMRKGQTVPLIHFDPAVRNSDTLTDIRLNGEKLNVSNEADVRTISFAGSSQMAIEFQRSLKEHVEHTLEMSFRLTFQEGYPFFYTIVSDAKGRGNEELFPTINTTHELARHIITFRVHGGMEFRCLGSGLVKKSNSTEYQEWILDTEREVASYTVMFVLVPQEDTLFEERKINGIDVRIVGFKGGPSFDDAYKILEDWLLELETNLGPWPMPRGLSVYLISQGGMEYYGAVMASLDALKHEVMHLYFGTSVLVKTYRDSWMEEAILEWYEHSVEPGFYPMPDRYRSNWVGARSPISVGFDGRAYNQGAHIMEAVARRLGGRNQMIAFLSYVHQNYSFAPFNTFDFLDYLMENSGVNMRRQFLNWLFDGSPADPSFQHKKRKVDMTPPESILQKSKQKREIQS